MVSGRIRGDCIHASIPFHVPVDETFNVRIARAELYSESTHYDASGHAAMAYTQSVLDRVRQLGPKSKPSLAVLRNANVAITGVRQHLAQHLAQAKGRPGNTTILAVLGMNILARVTGDTAALRVHNKILAQLVQARVGVNTLEANRVLKIFILHWESAWNLRIGTDPELLFPEARPPTLLMYSTVPLKLQALVDDLLPSGFRRLQNHFSIYTLEVLVRTAQAELGSLESLSCGRQKYRDSWEPCPCLREQDHGTRTSLEKLVVQPLILHCFCTFPKSRVMSMTFAGARTTLWASIVARASDTRDERAAVFWCWMCLLDSLMDAEVKLPPEGWLLATQMRHVFSDIDEVDKALLKVRLFFYDARFEKRRRVYWDGPQVDENLGARLGCSASGSLQTRRVFLHACNVDILGFNRCFPRLVSHPPGLPRGREPKVYELTGPFAPIAFY